jgi:hypothetical protein
MRLSKEIIQHIADAMVTHLESKNLVRLKVARRDLAAKIAEIITADLTAEDRLNKEVEKVLAAYEAEISKGNMDYRKVFELTKQKLARERGMVL